jgi:hypothetical protein
MPEQLSSPAEERGARWARSPRVLLAAGALAAAGTVGTLLTPQSAPPACRLATALLGDATGPVEERLAECAEPDVRAPQVGADPEGPHGPYPPTSAKCYALDPGV